MTSDDPITRPGEPGRDLRGELAGVIGAAHDPAQATEAVLAVLREFGRIATPARPSTLADFLAATATHLRAHPWLCEVHVTDRGELQLSGLDRDTEGWAIADWAQSLGAPVELTGWNHPEPRPDPAKATVTGTFGDQAHPVPVRVWDVVAGAGELLGAHRRVSVSAEGLRAWMATRAADAPGEVAGGERS